MKTKGIYFLYRSFQAFGLPLIVLYFLLRGLRNRSYWKSLPERFGFVSHATGALNQQTVPGAIWLHAVSVGEILAAIGLLKRLRLEFPRTNLFVSASTVAGRALAKEKLEGLAEGVFYAPIDYVWAVRRVLRTLQPSVVVVTETEIWPNLFREVKRTGAGLVIVNGRISDRALPRYERLRWFFRAILPEADCILAQTHTMGERFVALGAPAERVHTGGNLKHDFEPRPTPQDSPITAFLRQLGPAHIWIAASTMSGAFADDIEEDDVVIAAFQRLAVRYPGLLLILAPRKPEQFDVVARKLETAGIRYVRRSRLGIPEGTPSVLLLDSIGELGGLFFAADVVFLGGTLAARGGHNILEPAFFAKPVIIGPHMENFQEIADEFRHAQAVMEIGKASELEVAVDRLLNDRDARRELGARALQCAESKRGAVDRAVEAVRDLYETHLPEFRAAQPWFGLGWPHERMWIWGSRRRVRRATRRWLPIPVISIGNITMGGTGKTPCVLYLTAKLREEGWKPGILTRGYGRTSPERLMALSSGASVSAERTGDEPQLFLRSGLAPVGIGAQRLETGTLLCRTFDVNVALLDDGFQHVRLERDIDIVLVDALNPFGGGRVFPLGRLREPLEALARASLFLITRTDCSDLAAPIEHELRLRNPKAPIYRARIVPRGWVENRTGTRHTLAEQRFQRAAAFCGLGNPQSFRRMLERLGVPLVDWHAFEDHHRYRATEMRRLRDHALAQGALAVITTAKDVVNLCEGVDEMLNPLSLYWLDVEFAVEEESAFLNEIRRRLAERGG